MLRRLALALAGLLLWSTPGLAVQTSAGLGAGLSPDYEGSDHYRLIPLLSLSARWPSGLSLEFKGKDLQANLLTTPGLQGGPLLTYRFERDRVASDAVSALDPVDEALELGGFLRQLTGPWLLEVAGAQDVADGHNGFWLEFGLGYRRQLGRQLQLVTRLATSYASDNYMDSYFSVTPTEAARSGLPAFHADPGLKDLGVGLTLIHFRPAWRGWSLVALLNYRHLLGDAADSPLVRISGTPHQAFTGLLASYRF